VDEPVQPGQLLPAHGLGGFTEPGTGPGLHLDGDEVVAVMSHHVEFTEETPPVAFQDVIAATGQPPDGEELTASTQFLGVGPSTTRGDRCHGPSPPPQG
jgi:hypothetical protein